MRSALTRLPLVLALLALVASDASAQLPVPRLNSVFPCGARQGTTAECIITGADLGGATGLYFSHTGITAQPLKANQFKVTVAKDVPVGTYDVRTVTPLGVSNFRAFVVGDWPEVGEKEPNNELAQAQRVTLPVVVNGKADGATDVDHFRFAAKKGQRVFINCWAARIDSVLDGTLMVLDAEGKELAYNGDYYGKDPFIDFTAPADGDYVVKVWDFVYGGGNDYFYRLQIGSLPHLDAAVPAVVRPGQKTVVTFYGRNLPGGKPAPGVEIQGRPLETIVREVEGPADPVRALGMRDGEAVRPARASLDGTDFRLTTADGSSNPLFLGFTSDPIVIEKGPNNDLKSAQRLPVPCEVSGTLAKVGEVDYYSFPAKKGEKLVVEVIGERQNGLVDPVLTAFDPAGKRLVSLDDSGRNIGQIRFTTNSRDPRWDVVVPADGVYTVAVRDLYAQQRGDVRFTYRLNVRRARPDFRLVAVPTHDTQPDATVVGRGCKRSLDVLAFREDGFDGPITVEAGRLPPGVICPKVVIGPGKTSVPLVFHAAKDAPLGHAAIQIAGKAEVGSSEVVRYARGGGLTWPTVNTPGVARLADGIVLAVREPAPFALTATPAAMQASPGETVKIAVAIERPGGWAEGLQLSGNDLPPNATVALVNVGKTASTAQVEVKVPPNARPGTYTFTIHGAGQVARDYALAATGTKPRANNVRAVYPSNAITIVVNAKPAGK